MASRIKGIRAAIIAGAVVAGAVAILGAVPANAAGEIVSIATPVTDSTVSSTGGMAVNGSATGITGGTGPYTVDLVLVDASGQVTGLGFGGPLTIDATGNFSGTANISIPDGNYTWAYEILDSTGAMVNTPTIQGTYTRALETLNVANSGTGGIGNGGPGGGAGAGGTTGGAGAGGATGGTGTTPPNLPLVSG